MYDVGLLYPSNRSQGHHRADDDTLVIAAQSGCESAFGELCLRNAGQVFRSISRVTRDHADAEDALQDSLVRAFVHIRQFNRMSSFSSWLTRIGINSALMILRRKRRTRETALCPLDSDENVRQLLEVADPAANPEEDCLFNDSRRIMDYAIRRLPLQLRVVAELRLVRNLSMQEISAILNISVPATKSRLVRAKRRIAGTLQRHAEPRNARKHIRNKAKAG